MSSYKEITLDDVKAALGVDELPEFNEAEVREALAGFWGSFPFRSVKLEACPQFCGGDAEVVADLGEGVIKKELADGCPMGCEHKCHLLLAQFIKVAVPLLVLCETGKFPEFFEKGVNEGEGDAFLLKGNLEQVDLAKGLAHEGANSTK